MLRTATIIDREFYINTSEYYHLCDYVSRIRDNKSFETDNELILTIKRIKDDGWDMIFNSIFKALMGMKVGDASFQFSYKNEIDDGKTRYTITRISNVI